MKPQKDKVDAPTGGEPRANVEIWHWADERLLSVQKVQAEADRPGVAVDRGMADFEAAHDGGEGLWRHEARQAREGVRS